MCLSRSQSQFPKIFFLLVTKTWGDDCTHHPPTLNRGPGDASPPPPPAIYAPDSNSRKTTRFKTTVKCSIHTFLDFLKDVLIACVCHRCLGICDAVVLHPRKVAIAVRS